MGFFANVGADFKALPHRITSGAIPAFIVATNIGSAVLIAIAAAEGARVSDFPGFLVMLGLFSVPSFVITFLILSQRLKITLTIMFTVLALLAGGASYKGLVVDSGHGSTPSVPRGYSFGGSSWGESDNPYMPRRSFNGRSRSKPKTGAYWSLIGLFWLVLNISFIWAWEPKYSVSRRRRHSSSEKQQQLYAQVWSELESNNVDKGLWAQLWAENKGDEEKAKATYLKERVSQLLDAGVTGETPIGPLEKRTSDDGQWDSAAVDELFTKGADAVGGDSWLKKVGIAKIVGVIISIGVAGYYFLAPDVASTKRKGSTVGVETPVVLKTVPMPYSGAARTFDSQSRPVTLTIQTSGDQNYLVKLAKPYQKTAVLDVFVRGGNTEKVQVPVGRYEMRWATGKAWYGYDKLFGSETGYSKADKVFEFEKGWSNTVTLYTVSDGNLTTKGIDADDF